MITHLTRAIRAAAALGVVATAITTGTLAYAPASVSAPAALPSPSPAPSPAVVGVWVAVDLDAVGDDVVTALRDRGVRGVPGDGCECAYVADGTALDVPGGTVTVTTTGLVECRDWQTTGAECIGGDR